MGRAVREGQCRQQAGSRCAFNFAEALGLLSGVALHSVLTPFLKRATI